MKTNVARLILLGALQVALQPAFAGQPIAFKSVKVDLPTGDRAFPDGLGADTINKNCLTCHSAGMVLNQPALPRASWEAEVNKMRNAYKAPIDVAEIGPIVDYLTRTKGLK